MKIRYFSITTWIYSNFFSFVGKLIIALCFPVYALASTYQLHLDSSFVNIFSSLGYSVQARQGCRLGLGTWTHNDSQKVSVQNNQITYVLNTPGCQKDPWQANQRRKVQYVDINLTKYNQPTHSCTFQIHSDRSSVDKTYDINLASCGDVTQFNNNFLNPTTSDQLTATLPITADILNQFSPVTYLCDHKKTAESLDIHPFDVEHFFKFVNLYSKDGQLIQSAPNPIDLIGQDGYLQSAQDGSFLGESNLNTAPYYVRIKTYPLKSHPDISSGIVDIQYWAFYGLNGPQFFRLGGTFVENKNFVWDDFARHEGDWEHVTIRTTSTFDRILAIYFASHGSGAWIKPDNVTFERSHPVVYSACNSHATHNKKEIFNAESISFGDINIGALCGIWLKAIDEGSNSSIRWAPWEINNIKRMDDPNHIPLWLGFKGNYGPQRNNHPLTIRGQGGKTADCLMTIGKEADHRGFLPDKLIHAGGPKAPNLSDKVWINQEND